MSPRAKETPGSHKVSGLHVTEDEGDALSVSIPSFCVLLAPCPLGPAVSLIRQALGDCLRHFLVTNAVLEQETDWKGLRRSYK